METRNQQAAEGGNQIWIKVDPPREDGPNTFFVMLAERDMMNRELGVRFMLETHQISVEGMSGVSTNLTVTVQIGDETGERQVVVQGRADLEMVDVPVWQVLRAALEELFFEVAVA